MAVDTSSLKGAENVGNPVNVLDNQEDRAGRFNPLADQHPIIDALLLGLVALGAFLVRALPYWRWPAPYNIDGFPQFKLMRLYAGEGTWRVLDPAWNPGLLAYNSRLPVFSLYMAQVLGMAGLPPEATGLLLPVLGAIIVIGAYAILIRVTRSRTVAMAGGLIAAFYGPLVYFGAALMKESMALPLLLALVWWWHRRSDPRHRLLALIGLLGLGLLHHLTFLIGSLIMVYMAIYGAVSAWTRGGSLLSRMVSDAVTLGVAIGAVWSYYGWVQMPFYTNVATPEDAILLGSIVAVMLALGVRQLLQARLQPQKVGFGVLPILIVFALIGLFIFIVFLDPFRVLPVQGRLPQFLPALAVIFLFWALGLRVVARTHGQYRGFLLALVHAPATLILFSLFRGFDPFSFGLLYRSLEFIDYALILLGAIGLGWLLWWAAHRRGLQIAFCLILMLALAASIPLAYDIEGLYGIQDVTDGSQLAQYDWVDSHSSGPLAGDQRSMDIVEVIHDREVAPVAAWHLRFDEPLFDDRGLVLVERRWGDDGAQMYPLERAVVNQETLDSFVYGNSTVYGNDAPGNAKLVVWWRAP